MPLVQESPSHRSRPCNPTRSSRRRHTHSRQLQTMQRTTRSNLPSTKESPCPAPTQRSPRTTRRQTNAKTKTTRNFFEKRKFDKTAAVSVATILLQQAKLDNVDVFRLLDTLKGITDVQLSNVVTEILNVNRSKISTLGFKVENTQNQFEKRNIVV